MRAMPELTDDQLRRLRAAAVEIQRVICEVEAAQRFEPAATEPLIRCAAVTHVSPAGFDAGNDIVVDGEPE